MKPLPSGCLRYHWGCRELGRKQVQNVSCGVKRNTEEQSKGVQGSMGGWATALRGAGEVSPTRGHLSGDKGLETRRQGAAGDKGLSQVGVWAAGGHVAGGEARALVLRGH